MCGRYSLSASGDELAEAFGLDDPPPVEPRYNIAPTQPVLAVRLEPGGRPGAATLRWGWTAGEEMLINARGESAARNPSFREAYRRRRCLVPADGFYEWRRGRGGPRPYRVRRRDGGLLAFGALWEARAEGESCVILTTEANTVVAPIHERMPVIVPPEQYEAWLRTAPADALRLEALLRPYPPEGLEAHAVSPRVNSAHNEGPACAEPVPDSGEAQGLLFPELEER